MLCILCISQAWAHGISIMRVFRSVVLRTYSIVSRDVIRFDKSCQHYKITHISLMAALFVLFKFLT